jgi:hypothetical protein
MAQKNRHGSKKQVWLKKTSMAQKNRHGSEKQVWFKKTGVAKKNKIGKKLLVFRPLFYTRNQELSCTQGGYVL